MTLAKLINKVRPAYAVLLLAALAGCGGGAATTENPIVNGPVAGPNYVGPPPATSDIQAFKLNFWDNLEAADRCGSCHKPSQSPRFVRDDDINLAYQDTNSSGIVDLANPGLSRIVAKVRAGHHCWLTDANACGDTIVRWITAWASVSQGSSKTIPLTPPVIVEPGPARAFPATANDGGANSFANTVYPLLVANCAGCHRPDASVPQQPFFASSDVNVAFEQAKTKMNLDAPAMSRLVLRLRNEFHNCWTINGVQGDCVNSSARMEAAITAFAGGIPVTPIPPAWVTSKALGLYGGTVASGGSRYEANQIALYEFKTGSGNQAIDTSGVSPALNLTLSGGFQWVGGWGVQFTGGKAQAQTGPSALKLRNLIGSTGEYSIEAWAIPANVSQEESRIISYSGGNDTRNFMLGQTLYNYDFFNRSQTTGENGVQLSTPDAQRALQASLQHVVVTFDPVNGRRIYVNGVDTGVRGAGGQSIGNSWNDTYAFVMGNEVSNTFPWLGTLKLAAIHNRALTPTQVTQNFVAGVGEKYLLLFSVSHLINMPQAYVMFEVSQYDSYAYLFSYPKLISLDPAVLPGNIPVKGMRIGINGTEHLVGQAYQPLDIVVTDAMYSNTAGASLSSVGTIIGLERGPTLDEFFLTFEQLGSQMNVRTEPTPLAPAPPADVARPSDIGVNTFDGINETFAQITGVPIQGTGPAATRLRAKFQTLKTALPTVPSFQGFLASHQISVTQLAVAYCGEMVADSTLRNAFFNNANVNATLGTQGERDAIINPTIEKVLGLNLASQPDTAALHNELNLLISNNAAGRAQGLCVSSACGGARTQVVMKAVCGAALASAAAMIQ